MGCESSGPFSPLVVIPGDTTHVYRGQVDGLVRRVSCPSLCHHLCLIIEKHEFVLLWLSCVTLHMFRGTLLIVGLSSSPCSSVGERMLSVSGDLGFGPWQCMEERWRWVPAECSEGKERGPRGPARWALGLAAASPSPPLPLVLFLSHQPSPKQAGHNQVTLGREPVPCSVIRKLPAAWPSHWRVTDICRWATAAKGQSKCLLLPERVCSAEAAGWASWAVRPPEDTGVTRQAQPSRFCFRRPPLLLPWLPSDRGISPPQGSPCTRVSKVQLSWCNFSICGRWCGVVRRGEF